MRIATAGLLLVASGALAQPCPPGTHPEKQAKSRTCVANDFVPEVGKLTSPNQLAERAAWNKYNDAVDKYEHHAGAYRRENAEVKELTNKIEHGNCGQFKCQTQDLRRRRSSHEQAADRAKDAANDQVAPCRAAESEIRAIRARYATTKEQSVSKRNPACPLPVGVQSRCSRGMIYVPDKGCRKAGSHKGKGGH
jgi:hypothetical protein